MPTLEVLGHEEVRDRILQFRPHQVHFVLSLQCQQLATPLRVSHLSVRDPVRLKVHRLRSLGKISSPAAEVRMVKLGNPSRAQVISGAPMRRAPSLQTGQVGDRVICSVL